MLGVVAVPPALVEALIALSIVLVALELTEVRARETLTFTRRYPWAVAFAFGLLHGLGFAGALTAIGLPPEQLLLALFAFNVGVEIGQLLFVVVMLAPRAWQASAACERMPSPPDRVGSCTMALSKGCSAVWEWIAASDPNRIEDLNFGVVVAARANEMGSTTATVRGNLAPVVTPTQGSTAIPRFIATGQSSGLPAVATQDDLRVAHRLHSRAHIPVIGEGLNQIIGDAIANHIARHASNARDGIGLIHHAHL